MFDVGQEVLCVDASPAANPWHQQFPLVHGRVYVVTRTGMTDVDDAASECVCIDDSLRYWQCWRFVPLKRRETNIDFAHEILRTGKVPRRKRERERV